MRENAVGLTIVSSDDILEAWASEQGTTYAELWQTRFRDAEKQMKADLAAALTRGEHIIVDRTNMSVKVRRKMLANVPKTYVKFAAVFQCERSELIRRVVERTERTGRVLGNEGFTHVDVIDRMLDMYQEPTEEEFDAIFI